MPVTRQPSAAEPSASEPRTRRPREAAPEEPAFALPTELTSPSDDLGDYTILLYGEMKIGKTTVCAQFPDAYFLMTEPGARALRIYQTEIHGWVMFKRAVTALYAAPDQFKTVVVDTIDLAYEMCFNYVCKKRGIEHPNEERDWGQSWKAINDEFRLTMNKLMKCGRGIVFISHAVEREFTERGGRKYNKIIPSMASAARKWVTAPVDIIAYYGYYGNERLITIAGSDVIEAGHRIKEHFLTRTGERIHSIPCGDSEEHTYTNLLRAFNNRYREVYEPTERAALTTTPTRPQNRRG